MNRARWLFAIALLGVIGITIGATLPDADTAPRTIEIDIHYSHFTPNDLTVPAGVPITFVLVNTDPIDHEWIVGDAAVHERHRTGTEPSHGARPTEQSIAAGSKVITTVTFDTPGALTFVCHLPGHEAYGMIGRLVVTPRG